MKAVHTEEQLKNIDLVVNKFEENGEYYPGGPSFQETVADGVNAIAYLCHGLSYKAGWWHDIQTGELLDQNIPEKLILVISEVIESLEGYRKNLKDDKLPQYNMFAVELADTLIRAFDLAVASNEDIGKILVDKLVFNMNRPDHKKENRLGENGKKF